MQIRDAGDVPSQKLKVSLPYLAITFKSDNKHRHNKQTSYHRDMSKFYFVCNRKYIIQLYDIHAFHLMLKDIMQLDKSHYFLDT